MAAQPQKVTPVSPETHFVSQDVYPLGSITVPDEPVILNGVPFSMNIDEEQGREILFAARNWQPNFSLLHSLDIGKRTLEIVYRFGGLDEARQGLSTRSIVYDPSPVVESKIKLVEPKKDVIEQNATEISEIAGGNESPSRKIEKIEQIIRQQEGEANANDEAVKHGIPRVIITIPRILSSNGDTDDLVSGFEELMSLGAQRGTLEHIAFSTSLIRSGKILKYLGYGAIVAPVYLAGAHDVADVSEVPEVMYAVSGGIGAWFAVGMLYRGPGDKLLENTRLKRARNSAIKRMKNRSINIAKYTTGLIKLEPVE